MTALSWLRECTPQLRRTWMFHMALFSDLLSAMLSSLTPFFRQTAGLKWGFSLSPAVSREGFATWLCSGDSEGCLTFPAAASLVCLSSVLLVFICVHSSLFACSSHYHLFCPFSKIVFVCSYSGLLRALLLAALHFSDLFGEAGKNDAVKYQI